MSDRTETIAAINLYLKSFTDEEVSQALFDLRSIAAGIEHVNSQSSKLQIENFNLKKQLEEREKQFEEHLSFIKNLQSMIDCLEQEKLRIKSDMERTILKLSNEKQLLAYQLKRLRLKRYESA